MESSQSSQIQSIIPSQNAVAASPALTGTSTHAAAGLGVLILPRGNTVHLLPSIQPQVTPFPLPQIPGESFMIPAGLVNVKLQPRDADSQDEALIFNKIKIFADFDEDSSKKKKNQSQEEKKNKTDALLLLLMSVVSASLANEQLIQWSKIRERKRARKTTSPYSFSFPIELKAAETASKSS